MWRAAHAQHRILGVCSVLMLSFAAGQSHLAKMAPSAHCYERGVIATLWPQGTAGPATDVNIDNFEFGFETAGQKAQVPLELLIPGTVAQLSSFLRISNPGDYKFYTTSSDPAYFQLTPVTGGPLEPTNVASTYQNNLNTTTSEFSLTAPGLYDMRVFFFKAESTPPQIKVEWEYTGSNSASPTASSRHIQRGGIWRQQLYRHNCPQSLLSRPAKGHPHGLKNPRGMPIPIPVSSTNTNPVSISQASPAEPIVKELPQPGSIVMPPLGGQEYMPMPIFPSAPGAYGSYGNIPAEGGSYGLGGPGVVGIPNGIVGSYGGFPSTTPVPDPLSDNLVPGPQIGLPATGPGGYGSVGLLSPPPLPYNSPNDIIPGLPATGPGGYGSSNLLSPPPLAYYSPDEIVPGLPTGSYGYTGGYGGLQYPVPLPNSSLQPLFGKGKLPPFEPLNVDKPVASSIPAAGVVPPGHGAVAGVLTSEIPVQNVLPGVGTRKSKFADPLPDAPITGLSSLDVQTLALALPAPVAFGSGIGVSPTVTPSIPQVVNTIAPTVIPAVQGTIPEIAPKSKFADPLPDAPITGLSSLDVQTLTQALPAAVAFGMGNGVAPTVTPSIPQVVNTITPTVLPTVESPLSQLPMPDTITGSLPLVQQHGHWVGGGDEPHWVEDTVSHASPAPEGLLNNLPNPIANPLASPAPEGLLNNLPNPIANPLASPAPEGLLNNLPNPVSNPFESGGSWVGSGDEPRWVPAPSVNQLVGSLPLQWQSPATAADATGPGTLTISPIPINTVPGTVPVVPDQLPTSPTIVPASEVFDPIAQQKVQDGMTASWTIDPVVAQQPTNVASDPLAQASPSGVTASWTIPPLVLGGTPASAPDASQMNTEPAVIPTTKLPSWIPTIGPVAVINPVGVTPVSDPVLAVPDTAGVAGSVSALPSGSQPLPVVEPVVVAALPEPTALVPSAEVVGTINPATLLPVAEILPITQPGVIAVEPVVPTVPDLSSATPAVEPITPAVPDLGASTTALEPVTSSVPDLSAFVPPVEPVVPTALDLSASAPAVEPVTPTDPTLIVPTIASLSPAAEAVLGKRPAVSSDLPFGTGGTLPASLSAALANAGAFLQPDNHELLSAASGVLGYTATNTKGLPSALPNPTLQSPFPPIAIGPVPAAGEPDEHQLQSAASGMLGHPATETMGAKPAASSTAPDASSVPAQDVPIVQSQINRSVMAKPWLSEQDAIPFASQSVVTPKQTIAIGPKLPAQMMGAALSSALTQAAQSLPTAAQPSAGRLGPVAVTGAAEQAVVGGTELNPAADGNPGQEAGEPAAAQGQPHYFNIAPEQYQPINRRLLEKEERGAQRTDSTHVSNFITSEQLPGSDAGALRTRVTLISVMEHNGAERTPAEILSTLAQPGADTIVTSSRGDIAGQATSGSQASKAIDDTRPSRSIIPAYRPWSIISHINGALGCKGSSASLISCVSDVVRRWLPKKSVAPTQGVLTQGVDAALKQYNEEQIFHSLFNDPSVLGTQSWAEASKNTHDDVLRRSHAKDLAMHTVADALGDHANHGSISDAAEQD